MHRGPRVATIFVSMRCVPSFGQPDVVIVLGVRGYWARCIRRSFSGSIIGGMVPPRVIVLLKSLPRGGLLYRSSGGGAAGCPTSFIFKPVMVLKTLACFPFGSYHTRWCFFFFFCALAFCFLRQASTAPTCWRATSRTERSTNRCARSAPVSPTTSCIPSGRTLRSTPWRIARGAERGFFFSCLGSQVFFGAFSVLSLLGFCTQPSPAGC